MPALTPILAPAADVSDPGLPEISADDERTLLFDASELAPGDVIFKRNPGLLAKYELKVGATRMTVASASYDDVMDVLAVTVESTGTASYVNDLSTQQPIWTDTDGVEYRVVYQLVLDDGTCP